MTLLSVWAQVPIPCTEPPQGLVAWWAGDSAFGDLAGPDFGTPLGAVSFETGRVGAAFALHGGVDGVRIPASPALDVGSAEGLTIEAWINPQDLSARGPLVEWNRGGTNFIEWGVHLFILQPNDLGLGQGSLFANLAESDGTAHFIVTPAGTLTANVWQHVALTYDKASGQARLYRKGQIVATAQMGNFTPETSYDVYLGRRPAGDGVISYLGLLDEVAIYNRALAQEEIQAIVNADIAGKCKDPLAPAIVIEPESQLVYVGDTAELSVAAVGTAPLSYQWWQDDLALTEQTNSNLTLTNVEFAESGGYSVVVTSSFGSATSSVATLTISAPPVCAPAPQGLTGWWAGEQSAEDLAGVNSGTLLGGAGFGVGRVGSAFALHGGNDGVKIPSSAVLDVGKSSGLTVEAWIRPGKLSARGPLVEWNRGGTNFIEWGVHLFILQPNDLGLGQGSLFANLAESDGTAHFIVTPAGTLTANVWQHVALTYDKASGQARLYRNGQIVATAQMGNFTPETSYDVYLGRRPAGDGVISYLGLLDEVAIYNRALGQEEIQAIVNADIAGKCLGPENLMELISTVSGSEICRAYPVLLARLELARRSWLRGNNMAAINEMTEFQNKAHTYMASQDGSLAETLSDSADEIINGIDLDGSLRQALAAPRVLTLQPLAFLANGRVRVEAFGVPGDLCVVQTSADLVTWQDTGTAAELSDGVFVFDYLQPTDKSGCIYRLRTER